SVARAFYRDWYRPDLMSVVAVGDFDPAQMVRWISERFARIPMPARPRARRDSPVPDHAETLFSIETDREYPSKEVTLLWKRPRRDTRTQGDYRRNLVLQFHDGMLNMRFAEIAQRPDAPFAYAGGGRGPFVRTKSAYQLAAGVKDNGFAAAAEAVLAETQRARQFGFNASELERQKTNYLRILDQILAEKDKSESAGFAAEYVEHALTGYPVPGIAKEVELGRAFVPGITLAEVNAVARATISDTNRVILASGPANAETRMPTESDLTAIFERARSTSVAAWVDSTTDAPLVPALPTPGRIVSERTLPETGIIEWTLSNGARMLVKATDFKADEVLFGAQSPGGASLVSEADHLNTAFGSYAVQDGGLGAFTPTALRKKLTGKSAYVSPSVSLWGEHMGGNASRRDLETLFQLIWLRFTAPRVDTASFKAYVNLVRSVQANADNDPAQVFSDTISLTLANHHPRQRLFRATVLDSVNLSAALAQYRERFAGADDFTFFLVGSLPMDSVRMFTERYIASLPAAGRKEKARDLGIRIPQGVTERTVRRGIEPKAQTQLVFHGACSYSYENRIVLDALRDLLDIRLREVLREDRSGTYGVGVSSICSNIPYQRYRITVSFGSAPERRDELLAAMWGVIDSVKAGAIADSNMVKIREIAVRGHETALKENGAWMGAMQDADEDGRDQRDWLRSPAMTARVTKEQIRDAARQYLRRESMAVFTLLPEPPTTPRP
ncbi:MAG: insulinase family protein, partial [Gemmatimonadetes bacterium]|nr:insulinase family protein [Gemmatimonadota bacterium]